MKMFEMILRQTGFRILLFCLSLILFGWPFLNPEQFFGLQGFDPVSHTVFWTMFFNAGLYVAGSLCFKQSKEEQSLAREFVGALAATDKCLRNVGLYGRNHASVIDLAEFCSEVEKILAGSIGTAAADQRSWNKRPWSLKRRTSAFRKRTVLNPCFLPA